MKVRLLAVDMDGTLLDPTSRIPKANADALRRLSDYGVEFTICSGREYQDAKSILAPLGIDCAYICLSGGSIYDKQGTCLRDVPLTDGNLSDIRRIFAGHQLYMDIIADNGARYCTAPPDEKFRELCKFLAGGFLPSLIPAELKTRAMERLGHVTFIRDIEELLQTNTRIYKILGNELSADLVRQLKEEFAACPEIAAASSFPTNIELTNVEAQKGPALKLYADYLHIPLDAVMTIGDSDNDLSMFTPEFGYTVAMENAMDCISSAAKYHTKSNKENGVAYAIEQYIFSRAE